MGFLPQVVSHRGSDVMARWGKPRLEVPIRLGQKIHGVILWETLRNSVETFSERLISGYFEIKR